jgi:hypothetical protein
MTLSLVYRVNNLAFVFTGGEKIVRGKIASSPSSNLTATKLMVSSLQDQASRETLAFFLSSALRVIVEVIYVAQSIFQST